VSNTGPACAVGRAGNGATPAAPARAKGPNATQSAASGPRGGFRLAHPPEAITVAQVVEAVEGQGPLFHCMEIRQRGPVPLTGAACRKPCGIADVMHRAERAWRKELAATTIADLAETSGIGAVTRVSTWLATLPGAS
jgi:DNA-binding IscR family transcriptional regulator